MCHGLLDLSFIRPKTISVHGDDELAILDVHAKLRVGAEPWVRCELLDQAVPPTGQLVITLHNLFRAPEVHGEQDIIVLRVSFVLLIARVSVE